MVMACAMMPSHANGSPMRADTHESGNATHDRVRLDAWLWAARFFRTRTLAKEAVAGGKVEVNGATGKPARVVKVGDALRITRGEERHAIDVMALSSRRGSAVEAQALYRETAESVAAREQAREQRRLSGSDLAKPPGRPDKRARRLIHRFTSGEG
jgi:ribosome-associated heat shock protein Hsp15